MKNQSVKVLSIFLCILCFLGNTTKAGAADNADSLIFENYAKTIKADLHQPINILLVKTALFFQGRPYVASTLEVNSGEKLVVNLREFDCTTFVESCIALALTMKSDNKSFANFKMQLQRLRYRDGEIKNYSSRLHYLSDWIYDNSKKGLLTNLTPRIGGKRIDKGIRFMSEHAGLYPAMRDNQPMIKEISAIEQNINERRDYFLLPKEDIQTISGTLKSGDIVAFGTRLEGLDFSHVGIIYINQGIATFIHASSLARQVVVQTGTLMSYCKKSNNCNGIAVFRLQEANN